MNVWLEYGIWLAFIGACVWTGFVLVNGDVVVAQRDVLLDEMWGDT